MSDSEDLIAELEATVSWLKRINELVDADRVQRAIAALAAQRHTHGEEWAKEYATARRAEYLLSDESVNRVALALARFVSHNPHTMLVDGPNRDYYRAEARAALSAVLSEGESS